MWRDGHSSSQIQLQPVHFTRSTLSLPSQHSSFRSSSRSLSRSHLSLAGLAGLAGLGEYTSAPSLYTPSHHAQSLHGGTTLPGRKGLLSGGRGKVVAGGIVLLLLVAVIAICFLSFRSKDDTANNKVRSTTTLPYPTYPTFSPTRAPPVFCQPGYKTYPGSTQCIDIDECTESRSSPCMFGVTCINTPGSYTCSCGPGFQLTSADGSCIDIDECVNNNGGCPGACTNVPGSYRCHCGQGFIVSGDRCIDIDECAVRNGKCEGNCVNFPGGYNCECPSGYYLRPDQESCWDLDECMTGTDQCNHKCINSMGSYICHCQIGYTLQPDGKTCTNINECLYNNGGCVGECTDIQGTFQCDSDCIPGYVRNNLTQACQDINECGVSNGGCEHDCMNTAGSYYCTCSNGYTPSSPLSLSCKDINECEGFHGCSDLCVNTDGSYLCACQVGYILDADGYTCIRSGPPPDGYEPTPCQINNGNCSHVCADVGGVVQCGCPRGYTALQDGRNCLDINECVDNPCPPERSCSNTPGSYHCDCELGRKALPGDTCAYLPLDCCSPFSLTGMTPCVIEAETDTIISPNYPEDYIEGLRCQWLLKTPEQTRINLVVEDFQTEDGYDIVLIYDGESTEETLVAFGMGEGFAYPSVLGSTNTLLVDFQPDSTSNRRGFRMTFYSSP